MMCRELCCRCGNKQCVLLRMGPTNSINSTKKIVHTSTKATFKRQWQPHQVHLLRTQNQMNSTTRIEMSIVIATLRSLHCMISSARIASTISRRIGSGPRRAAHVEVSYLVDNISRLPQNPNSLSTMSSALGNLRRLVEQFAEKVLLIQLRDQLSMQHLRFNGWSLNGRVVH